MNAGEVALAALGRQQSGGAADGQELRRDPPPLQLRQQKIQADAMAADDDQVGRLQVAAEQMDIDLLCRLRRFPCAGRMVTKPSARLNVVTEPEPLPIG